MSELEIYFLIVEAAFQQFFHLCWSDGTWVGTGASIADSQLSNLRQFFEEFFFIDDATLIFLNAGGDVQCSVHLLDFSNQSIHQFFGGVAGQIDKACNFSVTLSRLEVPP